MNYDDSAKKYSHISEKNSIRCTQVIRRPHVACDKARHFLSGHLSRVHVLLVKGARSVWGVHGWVFVAVRGPSSEEEQSVSYKNRNKLAHVRRNVIYTAVCTGLCDDDDVRAYRLDKEQI